MEIRGLKKVDPSDPFYLSVERGEDLFLNIINPPAPLFKLDSFITALAWLARNYENSEAILVHCNQGLSRSPSLVLLFHAKYLVSSSLYGAETFEAAKQLFMRIYPAYQPGAGIATFLTGHWGKLDG